MNGETHPSGHLAVLTAHRAMIEAAMSQYLAGLHQGLATAEDKAAAHALFGVVLHSLDGSSGEVPRDKLDVRRFAARFGDGLTPILRDIVGEKVPEAFIARCGDRYWGSLQAAAA